MPVAHYLILPSLIVAFISMSPSYSLFEALFLLLDITSILSVDLLYTKPLSTEAQLRG